MKKYEFSGETKTINTLSGVITLHRIRAVANFADIETGELGGWIEKRENLSDEGNAWVYGNARVHGNARVYGNARVHGDAEVHGNARVYGDARVHGNARVRGDAEVFSTGHVLVIGTIGSRDDFTTFYRDKDNEITVKCGCFLGKIDRFLEQVTRTHGDSKHAAVYRAAAELAKLQILDK